MLKNYFTIALRGLARNKVYAFINIAGLALGITTCLVIFLIIKYELSYDTTFSKADNIYRITNHTSSASGEERSSVTPYPLGRALKHDFPEIISTQIHFQYKSLVTINDEKSYVDNIVFADSSFFDVFDFEVLSGNPKVDLAKPGSVFLTEEMAGKLLKNGATHIRLDNLIDLEVVGIIKKPSTPSHIALNMVASWATLTPEIAGKYLGFTLDEWGLNSSGFTYVVLPPDGSKENLENNFPSFIKKYYSVEQAGRQRYLLQPLRDIHFSTEYTENPGSASTSNSVLIVLGFISLFILVIACVNFINLSTALSLRKAKEVGVRKSLGAQQGQLALQYVSEAFLLTLVATILSVGIAEWVAPVVGSFLEKDIAVNLFGNATVIFFLLAIVVFTGILSGLYPAWILSRFSPVDALKSKISYQPNASVSVRKSLVVLQFFIAQVLIICTLVVSSQLSFFRNKSLGFVKEALINVSLPDNKPELLESFRNRLAGNANILNTSYSLGAPIADNNFGTSMWLPDKPDDRYSVGIKPVDLHYMEVYGLQMVAGRWFHESEVKMAGTTSKGDPQLTFVVNETTVKTLGFVSPEGILGKNITTGLNRSTGPVVGVVKDFHTASLRNKLNPVILVSYPAYYYDAGIKVDATNIPATMKFIEDTWSQLYPDYIFQSTFLDQYVDRLYRQEDKMFKLFEVFAGIAIFIGCLGLYGLASFLANQKTKEVAIRKTLGASVGQIITLFSKEFIFLVILAFVFAAPVAWYAMNQWLQEFAYKVDMGWIVFFSGIAFTLIISFATVGYRSLRAAVANPVDALKSE